MQNVIQQLLSSQKAQRINENYKYEEELYH